MLRPLLGRKLDGTTLAAVDERGGLGTPCWGPLGFLSDIGMRLGLPRGEEPSALRVAAWERRLANLVGQRPFYGDSYRVDPLGTAEMLLCWRDALVEAGWDGEPIANGGPRLSVFAALEQDRHPLPEGPADHLAAVEAALLAHQDTPYAEIELADDIDAWPGRWRRVLSLLAERGTRVVRTCPPTTIDDVSDLGTLHRVLVDVTPAHLPRNVRGDGTLVFLEAPTTQQAAETLAALVNEWGWPRSAFIRGGEGAVLDDALRAHGLPALGQRASSRERSALQVVRILLDLMFAPVDPHRVLELLDLTFSPFPAVVRHVMARALADSPGTCDVRWQTAKRRLIDAGYSVTPIEEWIECPRWNADDGAPSGEVALAASRIAAWLRSRIVMDSSGTVAAAYERCAQMERFLTREHRPKLSRLAVRQIMDLVMADGASAVTALEEEGRPDHVEHPGALLSPRESVVWWHFVSSSTRPPHRVRWSPSELAALEAADVRLVATRTLLAEESQQWRNAALRTRGRLVMVAPTWNRGERMTPHPFRDEILARLRLDDRSARRLTVTAGDVIARRRWQVAVDTLAPLPLPDARPTWRISSLERVGTGSLTARSLQSLLECPLRWLLENRAGPRARRLPSIPRGAQVNGLLAHRLVQHLVDNRQLTTDREIVGAVIDQLVPGNAAQLLLPGMSFELHQLRHQLIAAITSLVHLLEQSAMTAEATEEEITLRWLDAELAGRLDLRLRHASGREAVLDLKWGRGRHRDDLVAGRAVQLAVYALALSLRNPTRALPATGYFSMSHGTLLTTEPESFGLAEGVEGPTIADTINRLARTLPVVRAALADGHVPVTGVSGSRRLLEAVGVPAAERDQHFDPDVGDGCSHCAFDGVCGRAWEGFV